MTHNNSWLLPRRFFAQLITATAMASVTVLAHAIPSDRNQQITLSADKATYNDKTGVTTYSGNVIIQQGTLKVQADSIVAQLNAKREIQSITATGRPAKFQQKIHVDKGLAQGQAQKIIYNADTGIITLSGGAYLNQDGAIMRAETLRYSMNKGDVEATGSKAGRVQLVIPPSSQKSFPGVRD
ncbi:MAG: lipopolysaccharide transport periplasmic protein LptA [Acinetobacter sp.]|nr:lipopolysaccharide transport periplasmic protein LptA [Acinetobacter sp.]